MLEQLCKINQMLNFYMHYTQIENLEIYIFAFIY